MCHSGIKFIGCFFCTQFTILFLGFINWIILGFDISIFDQFFFYNPIDKFSRYAMRALDNLSFSKSVTNLKDYTVYREILTLFYFCPFRPRGQMQKYKKVDFLSHLVAVKFMAWSDALVNKLILNKKKNIVILTS